MGMRSELYMKKNLDIKLALKKSAIYGVIGPAVCGFFLSQFLYWVILIDNIDKFDVTDYFTVTAMTIAFCYVLGFFPAVVAGFIISSRPLKTESKRSGKKVFRIGFISTFLVLIVSTFSLITSRTPEQLPYTILVYIIIGIFGGATASFVVMAEQKMVGIIKHLRNRDR